MGTFHASVTFRNRIYMIHIACNIDHQFIQHCAVTLVSLFINNPGQVFCVHIVAGSLPQEDQDLLTKLAASYGHTVRFYFPPADLLKNYSIKKFGQRISMATYYRCMFPSILPETVDKVLYLDCDIVIRGDISAFWNTDLEGYGVACIEDIGSQEKERYELLHYDPADSYFNAGVLLINLRYWRETHVDRQCETYFLTYPERIRFNDQDLLNVVLHAHKKFVSLTWNMQDGFYRTGIRERVNDWKAFREELLNPVILHYTNKKPWNYDSMHPLRAEYFVYLDKTPWKGWRPSHSVKTRIKRFFKLLPYALKWRKPKYINLDKAVG